jgi:hypothetical protein
VPNAYNVLADGKCLQRFGHKLTLNTFWPIINPCNTNSAWAGNIRIQRFSRCNLHTALKTLQALWPRAHTWASIICLQRSGQWHMPTALPLARALAACIYGQSAVCTYHWPDCCRLIILAQVCALGQSACSVYLWPKHCVRIVSAKALYAYITGPSAVSVAWVNYWPESIQRKLVAKAL